MSERVQIGLLEIDSVTFAQAIDRIDQLVVAGNGGAVFTPNVDHVVTAEQDGEFRRAYRWASLSLVDGAPLLWASRLFGKPLPEKISGSDLVRPLMSRASQRGWRVYLTGGAPGVAHAAAARLREEFGIEIVGADAPRIDRDGGPSPDSDTTLDAIAATQPDLVLVGFGAPKQEKWIFRHRMRLGGAVAVAVGAGLDFAAGRMRRAPAWVSRAGFEWLFRLAMEPRRLWRRYLLRDPKFFWIVTRSSAHRRRATEVDGGS